MCRRKLSQLNKDRKRRDGRKRVQQKLKKDELRSMFDWFLPDESIFSELKLHGNTKWSPKCLVCLALVWAFSESKCLTDAFLESTEFCQSIFNSFVLGTYQGFMAALSKWTKKFMEILWPVLHQRMKEIGGNYWQIDGWVPIAFDGSRSTAPRSVANEDAFCAENYGKGKTAKYRKKKTKGMRRKKNEKNKPQPQAPQAWITLMWHMGLRLPWMWRLGPSNSSERAHVTEMIESGKYPKNTLYCGDAGFVGFPLWSTIIQSGGHFLVRVGGNVSLLRESADYELRKKGLVLCWGVEVEFRGLKQTLDRAKLRCRNDKRLLADLNWSIMAMAVAELFALKEQLAKRDRKKEGTPTDPNKRSLANTMRAIRRCIRKPESVSEEGEDLATLLRQALTDDYQRKGSKKARYQPPNPDKKKLGEPEVRTMTKEEKQKLRKTEAKIAA